MANKALHLTALTAGAVKVPSALRSPVAGELRRCTSSIKNYQKPSVGNAE
jgi:hypothetical protein